MKKLAFLAVLTAVSFGLANLAAAGEFVPSKEITVIVPSSAGGGSDLNARTIASIVQKYNLSPKSLMIVNQGGGSGAVGFTNTFAKKGDNHTLMILHSGQVMGSYVNNWNVKAENLTYISLLAFDYLTLCVKKGSPYKDVKTLIEMSKAKPGEVRIGGAQRGNSDHLTFELFNRETKAGATYVSFNGSGDVMSALLGGHVDVAIFNPLECIGQVLAGDVIPIAALSEKRIGGTFKDVPTFVELGFPKMIVTESRAIAGPPDMSPEAVKFYVDMLRKVTETEEWKKGYLEKNYLDPVFYDAAQTKAYFEKEIVGYKKAFEGVDMKK